MRLSKTHLASICDAIQWRKRRIRRNRSLGATNVDLSIYSCQPVLCIVLIAGCGGSNPTSAPVTSNAPSAAVTKNQWTWVSGSNLTNQPGSYSQQGIAASTNVPSARYSALSWTDPSGNFWLYGGVAAPPANNSLILSDLWKFSDGQWTWMSGSNATNQTPVYGTLGVPAPSNTPGERSTAATWTDNSGSLWLFGGEANVLGSNDLWQYSNGLWTWIGGPQITTKLSSVNSGSYGTKGIAAASNLPSGRQSAVTWTDSSGNFWLFGGFGYSSLGIVGDLNDLWEYSNGLWTWVSGSNLSEQVSVYGTLGVPAPANIPSGREGSVGWLDASGNLWLFGGLSTSLGAADLLNDLWRFSNGQWTWMSGSNQPNQQGIFGTQGTPSAANSPGARSDAATWVDSSGNFWLYSGYSATASNQANEPDDLWKYSSGQWTWVGGSQTISFGTYGTVGTASSTNTPGSRFSSAAWPDKSGRLWVFGGKGYGANLPYGYLNDLWVYQP